MIDTCEELRFIKASKYYSSKASAFPNENSKVVDPSELPNLCCHYNRKIPSGELWCHNIIVEKPSSLVVYDIQLLNYDIKFGLYKLDDLR